MPKRNLKHPAPTINPMPTIGDLQKRRIGRPSKPIGLTHDALNWRNEKTPSPHTVLVLGLGSGVGNMDADELQEMWARHGEAVTQYWMNKFGQEPFVASAIARPAGWRVWSNGDARKR